MSPGLWAIVAAAPFDRIGKNKIEIKRDRRANQDNGHKVKGRVEEEGLTVDTRRARVEKEPRERLTKCGGVQCWRDGKGTNFADIPTKWVTMRVTTLL
jgi:hypothetical protein